MIQSPNWNQVYVGLEWEQRNSGLWVPKEDSLATLLASLLRPLPFFTLIDEEDEEPDPDDFDSWEDYQLAKIEWEYDETHG